MFVDKCDNFVNSLIKACTYHNDFSYTITKPVWVKQTELFLSFWTKIKDDDDMIINFKNKVIIPFFEENKSNILSKITTDEGVIKDKFLQIDLSEDEDNIIINNVPRGLFLHINKVYLPVSRIYSEARALVKKRKDNVPYLEQILINMYKVCRCLVTDESEIKILEDNISLLTESLEVRDDPGVNSSNPMNLIQNMLGNIKFDQIGDMMKKVTSDENATKEFNNIFGKVSESLKKGENPMDAVSDLIKQASVDINSGQDNDSEQVENTTSSEPSTDNAVNQD